MTPEDTVLITALVEATVSKYLEKLRIEIAERAEEYESAVSDRVDAALNSFQTATAALVDSKINSKISLAEIRINKLEMATRSTDKQLGELLAEYRTELLTLKDDLKQVAMQTSREIERETLKVTQAHVARLMRKSEDKTTP